MLRVLAFLPLCLMLHPAAAAAQGDRAATLLTVGEPLEAPEMSELDARGGARWRSARVAARRQAASPPPTEALERLRQSFYDVSFGRCLAAAQTPELRVDHLLASGHVAAAATALGIASICAFQSEDVSLSRVLLRRAAAAGLDVTEELSVAPPELQRIGAEVEAELRDAGRAELRITTRPEGAALTADGVGVTCADSPCTVTLRPGPHVLTAERLGYRRRVELMELTPGVEERVLTLDPETSEGALAQLADALASGRAPDELELLRLASEAYSSSILLVLHRQEGVARTALFDLGADEVVARASASIEAPRPAILEVVDRWRNLQPVPLEESPLFWVLLVVGAGAVAAVAATSVALQPEPQLNLVAGCRGECATD